VRLDANPGAQPTLGVPVNEDGLANDLGMRLQVGGDIYGVADARIGHAPLSACEAGDQRPRGNANPDSDLRPAPEHLLPTEQVHQVQHLKGGKHRALSVIRVSQRRSKNSHDAVP
jgi:hypothetical protein